MKSISSIDWPELSGTDPNLLAPHLAPKDGFSINFYCADSPSQRDFLMEVLYYNAYTTFNFAQIGMTVPLRFKGLTASVRTSGLELFSVEFALDAVSVEDWLSYTHVSLYPGPPTPTTGLLIDGRDTVIYRARPLKGANLAITNPAPVKQNLILSSNTIDGQLYRDTFAIRDAHAVSIPMAVIARNLEAFWMGYLGLLGAITTAGKHVLTWDGTSYPFYYQSQSVTKFTVYSDGAVWCLFNLSLMFYEEEED